MTVLDRAPSQEVSRWLSMFEGALERREVDSAIELFLPDAAWRDFLAFTWNLHTLEGRGAIGEMLDACLARMAPTSWQPTAASWNEDVVEATATFETAVARCRAVIRLKQGKCCALFTSMTELIDFEETTGARRPLGHPPRYALGRKNWRDQREQDAKDLGVTRQPYCVIIGAGHSGLSLGARLKQLNVPTLILDRRARPSDTWRDRHSSLSLHSPCWFDEMPCLPYPEGWPLHPSKDQFADWLDAYRVLMDLDVWTDAECQSALFDEAGNEWCLRVKRGGESVELKPKQLVFATGLFGNPKVPNIASMGRFRGEHHHASSHRTGPHYHGRRCVVIGSGTTAHDIAAELWEVGADVTMIQRSPTMVMRMESLLPAFAALYGDEARARGMTLETADLMLASVPLRGLLQLHQQIVARIKEQDAAFYEQLRQVGFLLSFGEDEAGFFPQLLRDPSGYYIDVGASELIINGCIKLRSGVSVEALRERSILLSDGSELPADVIVYATGYERGAAAPILPEEMIQKVGRLWGFGSGIRNDPGPWEGELRNMWKPTRQTGLWFHSHGVGGVRFYSRLLALQIKARELGMSTPVYKLAEVHHREYPQLRGSTP